MALEPTKFSFVAHLLPVDRGILETIYFRATGARSAEELLAVNAYGPGANLKPREAAIDLAWALMNSAEFLYRH